MPAAAQPSIAINGRAAPALIAALLDLTVVDDGQAPSACTARFSNWGPVGRGDAFLFFDLRQFDFGATVEMTLGDATVFTGRVEAIDADYVSEVRHRFDLHAGFRSAFTAYSAGLAAAR